MRFADIARLFSPAQNLNIVSDAGPGFLVDQTSIPPEFFGLVSYASPNAIEPRMRRREAMQSGTVTRARNLICGAIGQLPLVQERSDGSRVDSPFLSQPQLNMPRSVFMTLVAEDLFYDGVAWLSVVETRGGFVSSVERLDPSRVNVEDVRPRAGQVGRIWVDGQEARPTDIIRIDSPNEGLLIAGARAIRTALQLETAALAASAGVPPIMYFTPKEPTLEATADEVGSLLSSWKKARSNGATAYVPGALDLKTVGWNPEQTTIASARREAALDIARHAGVEPTDVGIDVTTSHTYSNMADRDSAFIRYTLAPYLTAIESRFSMSDVTPRGNIVRFDRGSFLSPFVAQSNERVTSDSLVR